MRSRYQESASEMSLESDARSSPTVLGSSGIRHKDEHQQSQTIVDDRKSVVKDSEVASKRSHHDCTNPKVSIALTKLGLTEEIEAQFAGSEFFKTIERKSGGSCCRQVQFGKGVREDLSRRLSFYLSDFRDAFIGPQGTKRKTLATIWFLYFGILLPIIAFDTLNFTQTDGKMGGLKKTILGQAIGGLAFALLGGQPLVIIMTTAPLCLYTKGESLLRLASSLTISHP